MAKWRVSLKWFTYNSLSNNGSDCTYNNLHLYDFNGYYSAFPFLATILWQNFVWFMATMHQVLWVGFVTAVLSCHSFIQICNQILRICKNYKGGTESCSIGVQNYQVQQVGTITSIWQTSTTSPCWSSPALRSSPTKSSLAYLWSAGRRLVLLSKKVWRVEAAWQGKTKTVWLTGRQFRLRCVWDRRFTKCFFFE